MLPTNKIIAIIIVNFNGYLDTINCLNSLLNLKNVKYLICVVDNKSTNNSHSFLLSWFSINKSKYLDNNNIIDLIFLSSDYNGGFAYANNFAIKYLSNIVVDYYWFLNNDTEVTPYSLSFLVSKMNNNPTIGICGSTLLHHGTDTIHVLGGGFFCKYSCSTSLFYSERSLKSILPVEIEKVKIDFVAGASMLVSKEFIRDIGLMNESYFLYFEELDWAVRALNCYQIGFEYRSVVYHKVGSSIGTDKSSKMSQYYIIRALTLFYIFHQPLLTPLLFYKIFRIVLHLIINKKYSLIKVTLLAFYDGLLCRKGISFRHYYLLT
jgi:GT2 family glycosyltransferase